MPLIIAAEKNRYQADTKPMAILRDMPLAWKNHLTEQMQPNIVRAKNSF